VAMQEASWRAGPPDQAGSGAGTAPPLARVLRAPREGKQSRVAVTLPTAQVARWRVGLMVHLEVYVHREDALRELGVSEDALKPNAHDPNVCSAEPTYRWTSGPTTRAGGT
jgi:hypothetical protein